MPVRTRDVASRVDPHRFVYDDGVGASRWGLYGPGHTTRAAAAAHWRRVRPDVWRVTRRMGIPAAARAYDGLTFGAFDALWARLSHTAAAFDRAAVETVIAADRTNLAAFRAADPDGAAALAPFLAQMERDLELVSEVAESRQASRGHEDDEAHGILRGAMSHTYGRPKRETRSSR